ncbi:MAG: acetylglutamate kinase [Flavobacteriales bacterium]|nr:acetylglutamate kinase [Flavobacteriales bacterium]
MERLTVIKIGGHVLDDERQLETFLKVFASLEGPRILIHGGGKMATRIAEQQGIKVTMVDGRRLTDQAMLDVVIQVYGGWVNKALVGGLQKLGCNALGLTGADGNLIKAHKRPVAKIDYGFVGDVDQVNEQLVHLLLTNGIIPVCAPLTHDGNGQMLNTNADTIASSVAVAMANKYKVDLVYGFEKAGVLKDVNDDRSIIPVITKEQYADWKQDGTISGGMIPKLDNAFAAIDQGVSQVVIGLATDIANKKSGTRLIKE